MNFNFLKGLKSIFQPNAVDPYYSNVTLGILHQSRVERAARSLNEGILGEKDLQEIHGEKVVNEAKRARSRYSAFSKDCQ